MAAEKKSKLRKDNIGEKNPDPTADLKDEVYKSGWPDDMAGGFIKIQSPGEAFTREVMSSGRMTVSNLPQEKAWDSFLPQG